MWFIPLFVDRENEGMVDQTRILVSCYTISIFYWQSWMHMVWLFQVNLHPVERDGAYSVRKVN